MFACALSHGTANCGGIHPLCSDVLVFSCFGACLSLFDLIAWNIIYYTS